MKKEYRLGEREKKSQRNLGIVSVVMGFILIIISFISKDLPPFIPFILGVLSLLAAINVFLQIQHIRLTLSPEGIEWHQFGLDMRTTWNNVERIGKVPALLGLLQLEGVILRESAVKKNQWWIWVATLGKRERLIPLSPFPDWRNNEIGKDFKKYIPHLLTG